MVYIISAPNPSTGTYSIFSTICDTDWIKDMLLLLLNYKKAVHHWNPSSALNSNITHKKMSKTTM